MLGRARDPHANGAWLMSLMIGCTTGSLYWEYYVVGLFQILGVQYLWTCDAEWANFEVEIVCLQRYDWHEARGEVRDSGGRRV